MSDETATVEAPAAATTIPKVRVPDRKPAAKKPVPKKTTPKTGKPAGEHGVERSHDLPWSEKKVRILTALRKLKAVPSDPAGVRAVAEKSGLTDRDVRHYCYHAKAGGLVGIAVLAGGSGQGFYLTAKGTKLDFAAELKKAGE